MTPHMPPASAASEPPPALRADRLADRLPQQKHEWVPSTPFRHVVIDGFVPPAFATALSDHFPTSDHPVWLDWKKRSPNQYGKQGPGGSCMHGSSSIAGLSWNISRT